MSRKSAQHVHGTVSPGFESVKQLFEQQMLAMAEKNTQLCVYYRQEKVVDLWASKTGDTNFSADSLVNVFSSGKSLESIAVTWLASRGLLNYNSKITEYWPEFGAVGKHGVTIADLMRHEAGLATFDTSLDMEDLFTENIKGNAVGSLIEKQAPSYPDGGSKREYHGFTRGWIVNELFRRVDPAGRTIGEFLHEEISQPLHADLVVGVKGSDMERVAKVSPLGLGYQFLQSLKPRFFGRRIVHNIFQILGTLARVFPAIIKSRKSLAPPLVGADGMGFFNKPDFAMGETPSANAHCSARGLAKTGAMVAAGGKWDGREYLSKQACRGMHEHPVKAGMGPLMSTRFTQGGVDSFTACDGGSSRLERALNEGREGFYGWMGFGGSIFQWHPQLEVGFAFVPTSLHIFDLVNERGKLYQVEILKCIASITAEQSAEE